MCGIIAIAEQADVIGNSADVSLAGFDDRKAQGNRIDLKAGDARATVWTNDLTHAYVHENSAYSS